MENKYVLITPVHNEENFIADVIESVLAQTNLPVRWILVDDNSTDGSIDIMNRYKKEYDFIEVRSLGRGEIISNYSRRVAVVLAGIEHAENFEFDFLGVLDADIILGPEYYESILKEFEVNSKLGLASGIYLDKVDGELVKVLIDENHCPGGIHVFRKQCYKDIGGYIALKYGGDDTCAEITARMKGWQTRSFQQNKTTHLRPVGTGSGNSIYQARFRQGLTEYGVGTSPLFILAKSLRRAFLEKPYVFGSIARLAGFMSGCLRGEKRQISGTLVKYVRKEQLGRLFNMISRN